MEKLINKVCDLKINSNAKTRCGIHIEQPRWMLVPEIKIDIRNRIINRSALTDRLCSPIPPHVFRILNSQTPEGKRIGLYHIHNGTIPDTLKETFCVITELLRLQESGTDGYRNQIVISWDNQTKAGLLEAVHDLLRILNLTRMKLSVQRRDLYEEVLSNALIVLMDSQQAIIDDPSFKLYNAMLKLILSLSNLCTENISIILS